MERYEFSSAELDALKEAGTIGAGNAATVLATMLGQRIPMTVPSVNIVPLSEVAEVAGGDEQRVVGICLGVTGDAPGVILFLLSLTCAAALVGRLIGRPLPAGGEFDDLARSALGEVTNILSGAYLQALADFTGLTLLPTIPAFANDMAGAILDGIVAETGKLADYAFLIETGFLASTEEIRGHFFLFPDPDSLAAILRALGVRD